MIANPEERGNQWRKSRRAGRTPTTEEIVERSIRIVRF